MFGYRIITDQSKVTVIECGSIVALIPVAAVVVIGTVGTDLRSPFNTVTDNALGFHQHTAERVTKTAAEPIPHPSHYRYGFAAQADKLVVAHRSPAIWLVKGSRRCYRYQKKSNVKSETLKLLQHF